MATVQDPNQDANQPGNPVNQPISGTSAGATGTSQGGQTGAGVATPNSSPVSPVSQNTPQTSNTGFTDVSAYLNANPQGGQQIASQVASNLGNTYNATKGALDTSSQAFNQAVGQGYTPTNTDLISQVTSNPTAATPEQVSAFQAQKNDVYGGPNSWADLGNLQGQVAQAQQQGNLASTPGGLNVLTQQVEGPSTSTGINQLDTLLLGGSPTAMNTVQGAANQFKTLPDYLNSLNTANQGAINTARQNAANTSQQATGALTGAENKFITGLQNELPVAQQAFNTYNQDVGTLSTAAQGVDKQIQAFLAANPQLTGANNPLAQWESLQNASVAPTLGNVANAQDYATSQALQNLQGGAFQGNPLTGQFNPANAWALPQDLQAALANGAVPQAMNQELQNLSSQITGAYQPLQNAQNLESQRADYQKQADQLNSQINTLQQMAGRGGSNLDPGNQAALQDAQQKLAALNSQAQAGGYGGLTGDVSRSNIGGLAQQLQWLPGAATNFNNLITQLQGTTAPLGQMTLPQGQQPSGNGMQGTVNAASALNPLTLQANLGQQGFQQLPQNIQQEALNGLLNMGTLGLPSNVVSGIGNAVSGGLSGLGNLFGSLFAHGGEVQDMSHYLDKREDK